MPVESRRAHVVAVLTCGPAVAVPLRAGESHEVLTAAVRQERGDRFGWCISSQSPTESEGVGGSGRRRQEAGGDRADVGER